MSDDDGEYNATPIESETRECPHCRQETTWQLFERKKFFGLRKERYWACSRCGKREIPVKTS